MLKGELCVKAIDTHNMDKALVFCRTKLDCDNLERYFNQIGELLWKEEDERELFFDCRIMFGKVANRQ